MSTLQPPSAEKQKYPTHDPVKKIASKPTLTWAAPTYQVWAACSALTNSLREDSKQTKASELVPSSLLPHWNSMRFFVTVSLYD